MRTIERASAFKKDYKRDRSTPKHRNDIESLLKEALICLVNDQQLPPKNRDHDLTGNWSGYRECHLKPDLLLIYKQTNSQALRLARLGSHSELFG